MTKKLKLSALTCVLFTLPAAADYQAVLLTPWEGPSTVWAGSAYGISDSGVVGTGNEKPLHWEYPFDYPTDPTVLYSKPAGTGGTAYGSAGANIIGEADNHAALWWGPSGQYTDMNPAGFSHSTAQGIGYTTGYYDYYEAAGYGYGSATGNVTHALRWKISPDGSVTERIDLHPTYALLPGGDPNPWHPVTSRAYDVLDFGMIVGSGTDPFYGTEHALWFAGPGFAEDMNPPGFGASCALGISDYRMGTADATVDIVGYVGAEAYHAFLWKDYFWSRDYVDLNPAGFAESYAYDALCRGRGAPGTQVGYGSALATGGHDHALVWSDTADSCIDLHSYLTEIPEALGWPYVGSHAYAIDSYGNIVGDAVNAGGYAFPVLWQYEPDVVPLPGAVLLGGLGMSVASWFLHRRKEL
ncbi:MAG: hypothetical protein NTZ17_14790 [Phycisphaerae bacterium]|nr:hypothetical protein [Phycisphaerae bacterium]